MNALALTGQGRKRGCAIPVLGSVANVAKQTPKQIEIRSVKRKSELALPHGAISHYSSPHGASSARRAALTPLDPLATQHTLLFDRRDDHAVPLSPLCSLQSHRPQQPPQSQIQQQRGRHPPPMQSQGRGTRAGQSSLIPVLSSFAAKPPALKMCAPGCGAPGADSRLNYVLPSISGTAGLDASRSVPSPPEASSKIVLCREGTIT